MKNPKNSEPKLRDELIVTIVGSNDDGKKHLNTYDEDGNPIGCEPLDASGETYEADVVELYDDNGDSLIFEVLGHVYLDDARYFILTPYLEEEPAGDDAAYVLLMKEVLDSGESKLDVVADEALTARIFSAFERSADEMYHFI